LSKEGLGARKKAIGAQGDLLSMIAFALAQGRRLAMIRILLVMLALLSAWHTAIAAPWALPAGIKTVDVNSYPMAFIESGAGESVVLVHGGGTDYRTWRRQVESPPPGFRLIGISLRHYYPERWDGKGDTFSIKTAR
jgi:esterase